VTLRARLAFALGLLTAVAVTTMAVVGYRTTASRLKDEIDSSLLGAASRFADPDGNYARVVCSQLARQDPGDEGRRELADLPGTGVQCVSPAGVVVARSSTDPVKVDAADRALASAGGRTRLRTVGDDRIATVAVTGGAVQLSRDLEEARDVLASLRLRFSVIGAVVTALAALLGWLIARRVTRPVVELTAATESIVASGRLDADVPAGGRDETGRLAASFASMLATLRRARDQQQRLAQDAGHELRTPLTSLRANVEVLRRHPGLPAETRDQVLAELDSELRELSHLTDELVALVAAESDDEAMQPVDLAVLAGRAARRAQRRWRHPVQVTVEGRTSVVGQPRRLLRLLDNLLDNACKFDPSLEAIEVTVRPGAVEVRDHGPGIAPADRDHVFDRFYRSPAARTRPGSGLGLSIAHEVAVGHGGELTASNHPGGGALFTLRLPLTPDDGASGWNQAGGGDDAHRSLTEPPTPSYLDRPDLSV
jgi:two-component system sensor histidine kinase MprB